MHPNPIPNIGCAYFQSIIDLFSKIEECSYRAEPKETVTKRENGYSVSIIALTVIAIDAIICRIQALNMSKIQSNLNYFTKPFCNDQKLNSKLIEIYILRDSIVHNHVWNFGINDHFSFVENIQHGYGDKKYKNNLDTSLQKTKLLSLHVHPQKVGGEDVKKVFQFLYEFIGYVNKKNPDYVQNEEVYYKKPDEDTSTPISIKEFLEYFFQSKFCTDI